MNLKDRVIVVTGASRGQGRAEIEMAARAGAICYVADILEDEGKAFERELLDAGYRAEFVRLDVSDPSGWEALVARISDGHGRLDGLVNNAGIAFRFGIMDTELPDWERVLKINLTGPYLGMRALAPIMRKSGGGSIVNICSSAAVSGHFTAAYASSKWGLRGLSKHAAMEFAGWKIRVNSVYPGIVDTNIVPGDTAFPDAMVNRNPLGRAATVDDIANVVLFLLSDESSYMTASDVQVDGGFVDLGAFGAIMQDLGRTSY